MRDVGLGVYSAAPWVPRTGQLGDFDGVAEFEGGGDWPVGRSDAEKSTLSSWGSKSVRNSLHGSFLGSTTAPVVSRTM